MIEEDFYATIKFKSGEEIFCKVAASEEEEKTVLIISNPIIVSHIKGRNGSIGYKIEPWLKTTTEDMLVVNIQDVLTMSESSDIEMIMTHQSYVRQIEDRGVNEYKLDRKMGYLGNVNDTKEILEKIFKSS
jgi:hypothetical protein